MFMLEAVRLIGGRSARRFSWRNLERELASFDFDDWNSQCGGGRHMRLDLLDTSGSIDVHRDDHDPSLISLEAEDWYVWPFNFAEACSVVRWNPGLRAAPCAGEAGLDPHRTYERFTFKALREPENCEPDVWTGFPLAQEVPAALDGVELVPLDLTELPDNVLTGDWRVW